jgi:cation diffusion facilitator CzcD-associated flavoprotein CzcO
LPLAGANHSPRYCLIGAGAAGLGALREMTALGLDVDCFEKSDRVGGHWNTDYDSLYLITSRDVSGFPGYPMPRDYPVYPSRLQVLHYLQGFATEFDLPDKITFGIEVVACTPEGSVGQGGWIVETSDGRRQHYDGVLVANGHLWDPNLPEQAGDFTGLSLHSGQYHNSEQIEGSRVLVVGSGNSGCDLAVDVAQAGRRTCISIRAGHTFLPKAFFGRPRAELTWMARLPGVLQERLTRALVDVIVGPTSAYAGLPPPVVRNLNKQPPVVNNLLLYWIQHGRIEVVPGISSIDGRSVRFQDGTCRTFDTILWATGFRVTLPFLDQSLLRFRDGVPLRVAGMTVPAGLERIYFVGLGAPRGPQLPPYSAQTQLVAKMLRLDRLAAPGWSGEAFRRDMPDARIDIVRAEWLRQMRLANRSVDGMLRKIAGDEAGRTAPARSAPSAQTARGRR